MIIEDSFLPNHNLEDPRHPQNHGKVYFEVRLKKNDDGSYQKNVFINGELFDYSVDVTKYREACAMGPVFKKAVQKDIIKHFTNSVSEFLGRRVTAQDIEEAQKYGWI